MSREIIIAAWCDRCEAADRPKVPATHTYTLGLVKGENRPAPRVLELCDECDPVLAELFDLLSKNSIPLEPKAVTPAAPAPLERVECEICGESIVRTAIINHVWNMHRHGETKPSQPARCPECRESYSATGMAKHRSSLHGWSSLEDAYAGARR